ncbi:hypothetical protein BIW11_11810, partial [Tropilaelaps mercedesae]
SRKAIIANGVNNDHRSKTIRPGRTVLSSAVVENAKPSINDEQVAPSISPTLNAHTMEGAIRSPRRSMDVTNPDDDSSERFLNANQDLSVVGTGSTDYYLNESSYNSNCGNYSSDFFTEATSNLSAVSSTSYATASSHTPCGDKPIHGAESIRGPASDTCLSIADESLHHMKEDPDEGYVQHTCTDRQLQRAMRQVEITKEKNEQTAMRCMGFNPMGQCVLGDNCPFSHDKSVETGTQIPTSTMYEVPQAEFTIGETMFIKVFHVDETFGLYAVPMFGQMTLWEALRAHVAQSELIKIRGLLHETYDPLRRLARHSTHHTKLNRGMMVSVWLENQGPTLSGWHRGKLIRTDIYGGLADIFLVDHGREVRTTALDVFPLEDPFFKYPRQAFRCRLANVQPTEEAAPGQILSRLEGQTLTLRVKRLNADRDVEVDLFTECGIFSIAEHFIEEGLFRREPTSVNEKRLYFGRTSVLYSVEARRG